MEQQVTVMLVDPDADAREGMRDLLEAEGYDTMSAPPGEEARLLLEGSEGQARIVLWGKLADAHNGLQMLELMRHEQFFLEIALRVLNRSEMSEHFLQDSLLLSEVVTKQLPALVRNGEPPASAPAPAPVPPQRKPIRFAEAYPAYAPDSASPSP